MTRSIHRLTDLKVRKARKAGRYADGGNLWLVVTPNRQKYWLFMWKRDGTRRAMSFGPVRDVTLAEAREKARDARRALREERNPRSTRTMTFGAAADKLFESMKPSWRNPVHVRQWNHTLTTHCAPLRDKQVAKITTDDLLDVIVPLWRKHPETASRVRGRIEAVLSWAQARGMRDGENPARWRGHLERLLPHRSKLGRSHLRAVPFDEVPMLMAKIAAMPGIPARALEFTILTAARPGEARNACWDEIDLDGKVWTVPAHKTKGAKEHRVPLSARAIAILREMQQRRRSGDYVFPGQRDGKPLTDLTINRTLERAGVDATVHGTARSSFRDWAAERTNFAAEVCEMALGHVIANAVEAAYRRGDLFEKRRKLMDAWSRFCTAEPGKVIALGA